MSTNHTTNYDLNQWEGTDKVLRTEFNADNAKIDAALKANADAIAAEAAAREAADTALAAGNCFVKLLDLTLEAATQEWNIDMSGIDLSQYQKLLIYPRLKSGSNQPAKLQFNGGSTLCGWLPMNNDPDRQNFGIYEITMLIELPRLFLIFSGTESAPESQAPSVTGRACPDLAGGVTHLSTMDLLCDSASDQLMTGSSVQIYGLKR